jgi:glyoxylase-like metal-dependent hydrolase (beta-lactamase superfamily II)
VFDGVRRVTLPMPVGPRHVHCYLVAGADGWTLVDTGLGLPDASKRWAEILAELDRPVTAIVVTHFHPDHVGAAADVARLTGAPVYQGALDHAQCLHVWGNREWPDRIAAWFTRNGVPDDVAGELLEVGRAYAQLIRFVDSPHLLYEGDEVEGWQVAELPGHADGHICLLREGMMIAGDHLLATITPAVGLYPESRPDPLGDYLDSLERTQALAPRIALTGHGEPVGDPSARARDHRSPPCATRCSGGRTQARPADRLPALVPAFPPGGRTRRAALRGRRDPLPPGAARRRGPRGS